MHSVFKGFVFGCQKMRWVTYWFRLHNTTLFFYTKKEGHAVSIQVQFGVRFENMIFLNYKSQNMTE